ncbi:MAG TPA: hypothetical protein VHD62_15955 [Opitutaceae bacterium]|nr:hypothetical protein [Opitutaceae bacterium]
MPPTRAEFAPPAALSPSLRQTLRILLARWNTAQTEDDDERGEVQRELIALLADDNAAEIARFLSPEDRASPFGLAALERWLGLDTFAAASWLAEQPSATESQALLVARALLHNPSAPPDTWDRLPDSPWKQVLLATAGREIADTDPASGIALAERMAPGAARTDTLQTIAYAWISRDPRAAARWILSLEEPALREPLVAVAAKAIAITDPELAITWLGAVKSETIARETTASVAELWASRAPAEAAAWAEQFPATETRDAAIDAVARQWFQTDQVAADAWLSGLPDRERVLARLHPAVVATTDVD